MFHFLKKIARRCKEILVDVLSLLRRGSETSPVQETALVPATVGRPIELPIEVCEAIIGFLDNWDVQTIANCTLVCRRWVPFSRFKLYHYVRLEYRWQWTAFERLISSSASSDLMGYLGMVRQVQIDLRERSFHRGLKQRRIRWRTGEERGWTHLVLVRLAAYLPTVTRIEFRHIDWSEDFQVLGLCSGSNWHSLTTLELNSCTFTGVAQLHLFVTAFPSLKDLTLWDVRLQSTKTLHIPKGGHPLTRLHVVGIGDDLVAVTQWLVRAKLVHKLADLEWWSTSPDSANLLKTLTEAIDGPSLQKLYLGRVPWDWPGDLSRFASLRALKLPYEYWSLQEYFKSVNHILSSGVSSNQLEELDISLWHSNDDTLPLDTMLTTFTQHKAIDDLLVGPRFTHLHHVRLEYENLSIYTQVIPDILPSPSGDNIVPVSGSRSQSDPSNQLISTQPADSPEFHSWDPQHPLRLYAEPLVLRKIQDEMKQLGTRGILRVKVKVDPQRQERDTKADQDGNAEMNQDTNSDENPGHSTTFPTHSRAEMTDE